VPTVDKFLLKLHFLKDRWNGFQKPSTYHLSKGFTRSLPPSTTQRFQEVVSPMPSSITAAVLMFLSLKQDRIRTAFKERTRLHSQLSRTARQRAEVEAGVDNSIECTTCSDFLFARILECIVTCRGNCLKPTHFKVQDKSLFLTFMEPCVVIIILIYIQRDATLHSLFYLENALHISGGTSTHLQ
jgi:hypothetical protein